MNTAPRVCRSWLRASSLGAVALTLSILVSLAGAGSSPGAPPTVAVAPAPVPVAAPVSLHAWAKTIGFEATWVVKNQKLRLKHRDTEVIFETDRREISLNGVRVFLGEAPKLGKRTLTVTAVDRDHLLFPLLQPHRLGARDRARVIMLDAGHGGKDKGTGNAELKLFEKDLALDVVRRLQAVLEARGYQVVLSRSDDTFIELGDRPARAAKAGADLFLAVHFNATTAPTVHGIETYTLTPQYQRSTASEKLSADDAVAAPGNLWDSWNVLLGFSIHRQLDGALGGFDRGLKRARFVVVRDLATCPGVLIECGYLTNRDEAKLIATSSYRDQLATAIADGVDAYHAALNRPDTGGARPSSGNGGAIRAPRPNTAKPLAPR